MLRVAYGAVGDYLCESIADFFSFYITINLIKSTNIKKDILNNTSGSIANFASVARVLGAGHLVH